MMTESVHAALSKEAQREEAERELLAAVMRPMRTSVARAALFKAAPFAEALFDWVDIHSDATNIMQVLSYPQSSSRVSGF
jgi:hypothetical protein